MNGTVKWFNTRKGYGFIKGDDEEDYFVHYRQVPEGVRLRENDRVSFEAADTDRGKQAQNVQLLEGEEAAPAEEPTQEETPTEEAPAEETQEEPAQEEAPAEEAPAEEGKKTEE